MKKEIYGIEYNISDCISDLTPITKEQYNTKIKSIEKQFSELTDLALDEHYIFTTGSEELYRDYIWYKIFVVHYQIDTTDIYLYRAVCGKEHAFKNGINIRNLISHV